MHSTTSLCSWSLLTTVDKLKHSSLPIQPTPIYTINVVTTATFSSVIFHWDDTSYALPDTNSNWEENYEK
jgi:hypothetical protein